MSDTGALGLPLTQIGEAVQSLAGVLIDRGHDKNDVIHKLTSDFDEGEFWMSVLGPATDSLADALGLEPYPVE